MGHIDHSYYEHFIYSIFDVCMTKNWLNSSFFAKLLQAQMSCLNNFDHPVETCILGILVCFELGENGVWSEQMSLKSDWVWNKQPKLYVQFCCF